jgi:hypothetical protein
MTEQDAKILADAVPKLCEIAYIAGALEEQKRIKSPDGFDLEVMYTDVYVPILKEWAEGMDKGIFKNEEEEGYIGAYAQRRLIDLYGVK